MKILTIVCMLFIGQNVMAQNSTNELDLSDLSELSNEPVVSGFYNRINVGVLGGGSAFRSFNIINGYCFNEHLSAGLGLGIEEYAFNRYIPVFVEGNYNLLKSKTSPWVNLMVGYELPYQNSTIIRGGLTAGGKVGFSYFVTDHFGITTSVGYRYAHLLAEVDWWQSVVFHEHINRFEFRVGMVFK